MTKKDISGEELCDYLTWAYFNAVPLQGDAQRQSDYIKLVTDTCPESYYNKVSKAVSDVNTKTNNLVASGFLSVLIANLDTAMNTDSSNKTDTLPLSFTNYQALTSDILQVIAI